VLVRLSSLRIQLLAAMLVTGTIVLLGAKVVIEGIEHSEERAILRQEARETARAVARDSAGGADVHRYRLVQGLLGNDRLVVLRHGQLVFAGPLPHAKLTATATASFPDGMVSVTAAANEDARIPLELMLVMAAAILLVIGAALATATLIARGVRSPIQRAIRAADRVAAGDFSARMGTAGPGELVRLGRAFDAMAERLDAADRDQRGFLSDLAHEIATPVNSLAGFAVALADGSASTSAEREEAATMITREVERLHSLLTDLRDLTHLDLLESTREEPVDLRDFCEDVAARVQSLVRAADLTLEVSASRLRISCDRRVLEIVILNFLTNAVRYTPAGGRVHVTARRRSQKAVIAVRDTGIGISSEHRSRIFDRLYRVDDARDRASGGSGLGLALARRGAQALGAEIELDSEPGVGSEFRLVLPFRAPPARGRTRAASGLIRESG
jgi:signal transduction histidine kinase